MKLSEFVEAYQNTDREKTSKIIVIKYIGVKDKCSICEKIVGQLDISDAFDKSAPGFYVAKEMCKFFDILLAYTDMEVDEFGIDMYDRCLALGIDDYIVYLTGKTDYFRFVDMLDGIMATNDTKMLSNMFKPIMNMDIKKDAKYVAKALSSNKAFFDEMKVIHEFNTQRKL